MRLPTRRWGIVIREDAGNEGSASAAVFRDQPFLEDTPLILNIRNRGRDCAAKVLIYLSTRCGPLGNFWGDLTVILIQNCVFDASTGAGTFVAKEKFGKAMKAA